MGSPVRAWGEDQPQGKSMIVPSVSAEGKELGCKVSLVLDLRVRSAYAQLYILLIHTVRNCQCITSRVPLGWDARRSTLHISCMSCSDQPMSN
jgi:hypothetical protein